MRLIFCSSISSIVAASAAVHQLEARFTIVVIRRNYSKEHATKLTPFIREHLRSDIIIVTRKPIFQKILFALFACLSFIPVKLLEFVSPRPFWISSFEKHKSQNYVFYGDGFGLAVFKDRPEWLNPKQQEILGKNYPNVRYICQHVPSASDDLKKVFFVDKNVVLKKLSQLHNLIDVSPIKRIDMPIKLICLGALSKYGRMTLLEEKKLYENLVEEEIQKTSYGALCVFKRHPGVEEAEYKNMLQEIQNRFLERVIILDHKNSQIPLEVFLRSCMQENIEFSKICVTSFGSYLSITKLFQIECEMLPRYQQLGHFFGDKALHDAKIQRSIMNSVISYGR